MSESGPPPHERPRGEAALRGHGATLAFCGALVGLTLLVYAGTWGHGFVNYDDDVTIVTLDLIKQPTSVASFFEPTIRRGLPEYMPLKNLSYALDCAVFGLWPPGFRIQQQLWYVASVLLFFFWCRAVLAAAPLTAARAAWLAFGAAALFALHPAHVESVTWLSGRKDVLAGTFVLAAMLAAREPGVRHSSLALGLTALALLSKPSAVVLPGLLLVQDLVDTRRSIWRPSSRWIFHLATLAMCAGFAAFYVSFLGDHVGAGGMERTARALEDAPWARWGQQYAAFLRLGILPLERSPLYPPELLDPRPASLQALFGLGLLCLLALGGIAAARTRSPVLLAWGLFALTLLPVVLAPAWGQLVAARYLFHAVGGICLGLVLAWAYLVARAPRWSRALTGTLLALGLTWGALTWDYNATWRTSSTLWEGALRHYPQFTRLHAMAANAHVIEGRRDRAIEVLATCLSVKSDDVPCLAHMGELLLQPDAPRGEGMLRQALALGPDERAARALATHLLHTARAEEALSIYESTLHGRAVSVQSLDLLVRLSLAVGRDDKALAYARQMVRASAINHPGSPAPSATVQFVARALGDAELAARIRRAEACGNSACFQKELGW